MATWRDDPVFAALDLEDTFILSWAHDGATSRLRFDVELSVWPGHPAYQPPLPGHYTCYRRGAIRFDGVENLEGFLPPEAVRANIDLDGSRDFGTFDACDVGADGRTSVTGNFGTFHFRCTAHIVEVGAVVPAA